MSQEKVDRYKKEKAHRAETMKKQKRNARLMKGAGILVAVVLVVWVGYSIYDLVYEPPVYTYSVDTTALDTYLTDMNAANTLTEEDTEADTRQRRRRKAQAKRQTRKPKRQRRRLRKKPKR